MSQLQGDSAPTTLACTGNIVHLALWSPLLRRTRCGVVFEDAVRVDEPVNCMTCLTRIDVFEVPLKADKPILVPSRISPCWMKQVFGPPYDHITECCYTEDPCDWHLPLKR